MRGRRRSAAAAVRLTDDSSMRTPGDMPTVEEDVVVVAGVAGDPVRGYGDGVAMAKPRASPSGVA